MFRHSQKNCRLGEGEDEANETTLPTYNHKNTQRQMKAKDRIEKKKTENRRRKEATK